jgi:hypothetical protein
VSTRKCGGRGTLGQPRPGGRVRAQRPATEIPRPLPVSLFRRASGNPVRRTREAWLFLAVPRGGCQSPLRCEWGSPRRRTAQVDCPAAQPRHLPPVRRKTVADCQEPMPEGSSSLTTAADGPGLRLSTKAIASPASSTTSSFSSKSASLRATDCGSSRPRREQHSPSSCKSKTQCGRLRPSDWAGSGSPGSDAARSRSAPRRSVRD